MIARAVDVLILVLAVGIVVFEAVVPLLQALAGVHIQTLLH
jgi:hypothetical protein